MRFRSQTDVDCLALCANLNTYINYLLDKRGDPSNIESLPFELRSSTGLETPVRGYEGLRLNSLLKSAQFVE